MPRHSIDRRLGGGSLGPGGLEDADLRTSPDLSALFMVGYDPKKQVVYLAVIVSDDELVVGKSLTWTPTPWNYTSMASTATGGSRA